MLEVLPKMVTSFHLWHIVQPMRVPAFVPLCNRYVSQPPFHKLIDIELCLLLPLVGTVPIPVLWHFWLLVGPGQPANTFEEEREEQAKRPPYCLPNVFRNLL